MTENCYVHIPFCGQKCKYCSFVSFPGKISEIEKYIKCLRMEILSRYKGEPLKTLYFGGGTPSLLNISQIKSVIDNFVFTLKPEITLEANPESLTFDYVSELKNIGINRLSLGAQTFDENILRIIGRKHSGKDIFRAVENAKKAGFENISIDLMYGLPEQNIKVFEKDLEKALNLDISHISSYGLKISEGCMFFENPPENLPDNDICADMYEFMHEFLTSNGFEHYETSNFAKPGKYSLHNLNYWNCGNYYGFGCGASGYEENTRYTNALSLEEYFEDFNLKSEEISLTSKDKFEEEIFIGLGKFEGINVQKLKEKYNIDFWDKYSKQLEKYRDYFVINENTIKFTVKGMMLSNFILSEFI